MTLRLFSSLAMTHPRRVAGIVLMGSFLGAEYAYSTEEFSVIASDGVTLSGDIVYPRPLNSEGLFPVVIVVHGSGCNTRTNWEDQTEPLLHQGYAIARYDKRGCGKSAGDWRTVKLEQVARDVVSVAKHIKNRSRSIPRE